MSDKSTNRKINIWINGRQVENTYKGISNAMRIARKELANMTIGSKEYIAQTKKIKQLQGLMDEHRKQIGRINTGWAKVKKEFSLTTLGFAGGLASVIGVLKNAFQVFTEFSRSVSKLKGILGATDEEMKLLTTNAKDLGATTAYTASQVVELQTELAKLGFSANEIALMTESTLNAAAAMGSELWQQAALTGAVLRSFEKDAKDAAHVNDVLALATTKTALDFSKLQTALPIVSATAKAAGVDLERLTALLGTMADRGIDASSSATALRNIFLRLAKSGKTWNEAMNEINNSTNKNATAMKLFGVNSSTAATILAVTSNEASEGKIKFDELEQALRGADGAASELAETMLDNLSGDITKAQSAWEGFILSIEDGEGIISKAIRGIVQYFTDFISQLTLFNEVDFVNKLKLIANAALSMFEKAFLPLLQAIEYFTGKKLSFRFDVQKTKEDLDIINESLDETIEKKEKLENNNKGRNNNRSSSANKKSIDDYKEYISKYERLSKLIIQIRQQLNLQSLSEEEKAIELIKQKYQEQFDVLNAAIAELENIKNKKGKLNDKELELLNKFYEQRKQLSELQNEEFINAEKKFEQKRLSEKQKVQAQIDEILMNDKQREIHAVTKKYKELIDKAEEYGIDTVELYKKMNEELARIQNEGLAERDIFGMTQEDWDRFMQNVNDAIQIAGEISDIISLNNQKVANEEAAKLQDYEKNNDKKKAILKERLDKGLISEKYYNDRIKALDAELDKEKAKIAEKQAKRDKEMQKFSATINMLSGLAQIWANQLGKKGLAGIPLAAFLSGLLIAKATMQISAINSQPIPAFAKGARVNKPTTALIGEAGPEIVLSSSIVTDKNLGPIADDLARIQEGKKPNFLRKPANPNFAGMETAISNKSNMFGQTTIINQTDNTETIQMREEISKMRNDISEMTNSVKELKYLRAVITNDDLIEHEQEEQLRLKYSVF